MRALMLEVPTSLLEERRRLGLDLFDEMWEGELHMVPPPTSGHQSTGTDLLVVLVPIALAVGLRMLYETGLYDPDVADHSSYRVPDLSVFDPAILSARGIEGAAHLVVEIRSPGDESYDKLPYYERLGVREVLIVDPSERTVRLWTNRPDGLSETTPDADGGVTLGCLPVTLTAVGHTLRVSHAGLTTDIPLGP